MIGALPTDEVAPRQGWLPHYKLLHRQMPTGEKPPNHHHV